MYAAPVARSDAQPRPERRDATPLFAHRFAVADPQFVRTMGSAFGPAILPGHRIDALVNGDRIFPAMLEAIARAERSINFETYIYWSGDIGRRFAEALAAKARAGVAVKVLLDWVGSIPMKQTLIDMMRDAGVEVRRYHKPRWYNLHRMNNRTHRKVLVVDGRIGFTGGVGIADEWGGDARTPDEWRDNHYRVAGPAVAQMQATFAANWTQTTGEPLYGEAYYPSIEPAGETHAQLVKSSPLDGSENMRLMFLLAVAAAERSIRIAASYFVPDDEAIAQLLAARRRGVAVEVLVPGKYIDKPSARQASRWHWGRMLEEGVRIFEFQPTMFHAKVMIVDEAWTTIGSANFDVRSFRLNDEANLNVYDLAFAAEQLALFEADKARCREITLEMWRRRPLRAKAADWAYSLLRAQL